MPTITGSIDDPEFRTARARLAGQAAQSTAALIKRLVARMPELTDKQVETIRRALPPAEADEG